MYILIAISSSMSEQSFSLYISEVSEVVNIIVTELSHREVLAENKKSDTV